MNQLIKEILSILLGIMIIQYTFNFCDDFKVITISDSNYV